MLPGVPGGLAVVPVPVGSLAGDQVSAGVGVHEQFKRDAEAAGYAACSRCGLYLHPKGAPPHRCPVAGCVTPGAMGAKPEGAPAECAVCHKAEAVTAVVLGGETEPVGACDDCHFWNT